MKTNTMKTTMAALRGAVAAVYDRRSSGCMTPPSRRSAGAATRRSQTAATAGVAALLALAMAGGLRAAYGWRMSTVQEIEAAIEQLPPDSFRQLRCLIG